MPVITSHQEVMLSQESIRQAEIEEYLAKRLTRTLQKCQCDKKQGKTEEEKIKEPDDSMQGGIGAWILEEERP